MGTHASSAQAEWLDGGLLCRPTGIANANAPLSVVVGRRGVVVGSSRAGVVSRHYGSVVIC